VQTKFDGGRADMIALPKRRRAYKNIYRHRSSAVRRIAAAAANFAGSKIDGSPK
jgi:hypothetical protein